MSKKKQPAPKQRRPRSWRGFAVLYGDRAVAVVADGEDLAHVRMDRAYRVREVTITERTP